MIRYVRQRDRYSCGAVAYLNIMKWANYKTRRKMPTYKSLKKYKKLLGTTPGVGTHSFAIQWALDKNKHLDYEYIMPHISKVEENIKNDKILYIHYTPGHRKEKDHAFILTKSSKNGKRFTAINLYTGKTKRILTRKELVKILRSTRMCLAIERIS